MLHNSRPPCKQALGARLFLGYVSHPLSYVLHSNMVLLVLGLSPFYSTKGTLINETDSACAYKTSIWSINMKLTE